jgi:glycosyltransferase involved in cell wall biosynthesis
MINFNVVGDIFNSTGYASHTRGIINALFNYANVRLSTTIIPDWNRHVNDKELEMIKRQPEKDEINLIITNPLYWRLNLGSGRNWCYLVWEGDKIPKCFIEECLNPDIEKILVPSQHTKDAILNTLKDVEFLNNIYPWTNKIKIIPHGIDLNLFYPKEKPKKCTFIANKGLRGPEDRGGIQYLIKAYIEEFTNEEVELILRINPAYGLIDIKKLTNEIVKCEVGKVQPKITVADKPMEYNNLVNLYNKGTVFVSPTRAEAFNIPCLEAMGCGLPVITTNFGGQTDYVNESNGWLIGGEKTEVKWDLMYEGIKWLTPNITELREALRYCFEHPDEVKSKGLKAIEDARKLTWDNSVKKIMELI